VREPALAAPRTNCGYVPSVRPAVTNKPADQASPLVASAAVLVDVDNYDELRDVVDDASFSSRLMSLTRDFLAVCDQPVDQLTIRLYGGWFEGAALTARASEYAKLAQMGDPFPLVTTSRRISGHVELAMGPITSPGMILPHTYRRRGSAPRLKRTPGINDPSCCGNSACSARRLAGWTESPRKVCPTPECNVTYADAFFGSEQKMIDALLSMDLIEMITSSRMSAVAVVSDDTDFIPALLYAAGRGQGQVISMRRRRLDDLLADLLADAGVDDLRVA